jgi:hypothetical protein
MGTPTDKHHISRRDALLLAAGATAAAGFDVRGRAIAQPMSAESFRDPPIKAWPIKHGGIKPMAHERLAMHVNAQSAVVTFRFFRPCRLERVEIPAIVYGRARPPVPCHPAHIIVSVYDDIAGRWKVIRELDIPENSKFAGRGLSDLTPQDEQAQFFEDALREAKPVTIDLGGLESDHLRLECDREHPTWPNFTEMNGGAHNVPFGIFNKAAVYGTPNLKYPIVQHYHEPLRHGSIRPAAPATMEVEIDPRMVLFRSAKLAIGFSLHRPLLLHLGWDDMGLGRTAVNRLLATHAVFGRSPALGGAMSGPMLRTLNADTGSHLWSGLLEIQGNEVRYKDLASNGSPTLNVTFRVESENVQMHIEQTSASPIAALEYEAWRFAWDTRTSPTGISAVPSQIPGRNGHVLLPAYFSGEGSGCLHVVERIEAQSARKSYLQVESYREAEALTAGLVIGERSADGFGVSIPAGFREATIELRVASLLPRLAAGLGEDALSPGIKRHWSTIYSCYRAEYRGFSNNCVSVNCHLGQAAQIEILAHTHQLAGGPDLLGMHRFTIEKALLDGGGYGYWREYFMDSDPTLLCATGAIYRMDPNRAWFEHVRPALNEVFDRMISKARNDGLLVQQNRSGNSGEFTLSTNGIDPTCFGWLDAFSNAWAYRALYNAAPIFVMLKDRVRAGKALDIAAKMRRSYAKEFLNPETGWIAGWRSRDGQLHDPGYLGINGLAIAYGLLDPQAARRALVNLEARRAQVCRVSPQIGLPYNLVPTKYEDQIFPQLIGGSDPTYELFCDGGLSTLLAGHYIRALSCSGFKTEARKLADELDAGYAAGFFTGAVGSGNEMRSWEGMPSGYEGTLIYSLTTLYAVAVEKGFIAVQSPEWWPALPKINEI